MEAEKQREIARKGGRAAHEKGTAHEFDSEEARAAGRKGGEVVSQNREHMAEIGAKGGHASHSNRQSGSRARAQQRSSQGLAATHEESGNVSENQQAGSAGEREDRPREAQPMREREDEESGS
jgi:general stress protein YciG